MSTDANYRPTGKLQGDTKEIPYKGTTTNVTDTYGADIGEQAKNRKGSITDGTQSDPPEQNIASKGCKG